MSLIVIICVWINFIVCVKPETDKFTIYSSAMSWHEASEGCLKEGGHLAVLNDMTLPYLSNYLNNISDTLWIGHYLTPWIWLKGCYKLYGGNFTSIPEYNESKENQAKLCQQNCKDYVYFGLQEYKCFCLTNLDLEASEFVSSSHVCEFQCPGNKTERCGGSDSVTMYMNDICWQNSSTWNHKVSRTISGLSCQKWVSNEPHPHLFHSDEMFSDGSEVDASNYCRDPDGKGAPWCFTTDPEVPWQFCDVPPCEGTCWQNPSKYTGTLNTTIRGYTCRPWTDTPPSRFQAFHEDSMFPDNYVADASDYCRSPNSDSSLWCYVNSNERVWDYCGSPPCFGNRNYQESEDSLCRLYWATESEFFSKKHSCSEKEKFACFISELRTEIDTSKDTFIQAVSHCRRQYYSLANYLFLFGDSTRQNSRYWIGNFRAKDTVSWKDATPTPSLCYAAKHNGTGLLLEFQESCDDKFGFVCQKEAIVCGETVTTPNGTIHSPNYPEGYSSDLYCLWEVSVPEGYGVVLTFNEVDIENSKDCSYDYVEVLESLENVQIQKLCGKALNLTVMASANKVKIKFRSDKYGNGSGFLLEWRSEHTQTHRRTDTTLEPGHGGVDQSEPSSTFTIAVVSSALAVVSAVIIVGVIFCYRLKCVRNKATARAIDELDEPSVSSHNSQEANIELQQPQTTTNTPLLRMSSTGHYEEPINERTTTPADGDSNVPDEHYAVPDFENIAKSPIATETSYELLNRRQRRQSAEYTPLKYNDLSHQTSSGANSYQHAHSATDDIDAIMTPANYEKLNQVMRSQDNDYTPLKGNALTYENMAVAAASANSKVGTRNGDEVDENYEAMTRSSRNEDQDYLHPISNDCSNK